VTAVGRLLRTMRHAGARPIGELGAAAGISPLRLRGLARGTAELEYLEGIRLAKALDLCPNCFRLLLEAAAERDSLNATAAHVEGAAVRLASAGQGEGRKRGAARTAH